MAGVPLSSLLHNRGIDHLQVDSSVVTGSSEIEDSVTLEQSIFMLFKTMFA